MIVEHILCSPFFEIPDFSCRPIENWVKDKTFFVKRILDKYTDLISNLQILGITTCLLISKIFEKTPKILPQLIKVYSYAGIIQLNVQISDFVKSGKDFLRAFESSNVTAMIETAAKVFVKGVNIILTCVFFGGSILTVIAFPEASLVIALCLRPLSLTSLAINILSDIRDYFANEALLKRLEKIKTNPIGTVLINKVMECFLEIVKDLHSSPLPSPLKKEWKLADRLVRQLDHYTLETFKESLIEDRKEKNPLIDALKLFDGVVDGMKCNQAITKSNLSLTALGYVSMTICRAFPDSLLEMVIRWSISALYTHQSIKRTFFQSELAERIN